MKRGGAAQIKFRDTEDKAKFASYLQESLDRWRYAQANRTWASLAQKLDIGEDQVAKYVRARAVPSKPVMAIMLEDGVVEGWVGETVTTFLAARPWAEFEPDAGVMQRAVNQGKKPKAKKAAPAPVLEVSSPEFEVPTLDIYDAIHKLDIPTKAKMQVAALVALAESGAVFDLDVKVRAR